MGAMAFAPALKIPKDPLLLLLSGLLAATLLAFFLGVIPYPYGVLVLLAFLWARILYKA